MKHVLGKGLLNTFMNSALKEGIYQTKIVLDSAGTQMTAWISSQDTAAKKAYFDCILRVQLGT